jgi:hypothetical protein
LHSSDNLEPDPIEEVGSSVLRLMGCRGVIYGCKFLPVDLYGNPHTHNLPALLVPDLDRYVPGIALRQVIPSNFRRALSRRTFGSIQAVELKTGVITDVAVTLPHVKVEPWHRDLSLKPGAFKLSRRRLVWGQSPTVRIRTTKLLYTTRYAKFAALNRYFDGA